MFTILNRLRGTNGVWSKFNGLLISYILLSVFNNHYVALSVGILYVIGESFGWGDWVGTVSERSHKYMPVPYNEGINNYIQWLATKIIDPSKDWLNHCRVALIIRGFYWYVPILFLLFFVGISPYLLVISMLFLSISFWLSYELGYLLKDKISFERFGLSFKGGWELGEAFVGCSQDIILILFLIYYLG